MDISVVIPAFNYAEYVGRAIDSVMVQTGGDFEAVVVDDGSSDETPAVLEQYRMRFPNGLVSVRQLNAGVSAARNRGIDLACGEFVLFLDADDRLLPGGLELLMAASRRQPDADLIIGGRQVDTGRRIKHRYNHQLPRDRAARFMASLENRIDICNGCFMVRRAVLENIRYPEKMHNMEDPVFRGLLFANLDASCFPDPVMVCFRHPGSLRYDTTTLDQNVETAVGALFDHPKMPPEFNYLRNRVAADHYLGIYRRLMDAGRFREALVCYKRALSLQPGAALRFTYLSKALRGWIKNRKSEDPAADRGLK